MTELERAITRWTEAGLISAEQSERIRDAEGISGGAVPAQQRRLPLLSEALGYLGGSLALVAVGLLVGRLWADLDDWARVVLPAFGAIVLWAAGFVAGRSEEPALRRLRSFLWLLSPGALVLAGGIYGDQVADLQVEETALLCSAIALVYTIALWVVARSVPQHIATFASVVALAVSLLIQIEHVDFPYFGLLVWVLGLAWACLSWGDVVRPPAVGYALGAAALLVGANLFAIDDLRTLGLLLGLITAAAMIGSAVILRATTLLWFGAAGVFIVVPQATFEFFGDTLGAPVALFIAGIIVLATGLIVPRLRRLTRETP